MNQNHDTPVPEKTPTTEGTTDGLNQGPASDCQVSVCDSSVKPHNGKNARFPTLTMGKWQFASI